MSNTAHDTQTEQQFFLSPHNSNWPGEHLGWAARRQDKHEIALPRIDNESEIGKMSINQAAKNFVLEKLPAVTKGIILLLENRSRQNGAAPLLVKIAGKPSEVEAKRPLNPEKVDDHINGLVTRFTNLKDVSPRDKTKITEFIGALQQVQQLVVLNSSE